MTQAHPAFRHSLGNGGADIFTAADLDRRAAHQQMVGGGAVEHHDNQRKLHMAENIESLGETGIAAACDAADRKPAGLEGENNEEQDSEAVGRDCADQQTRCRKESVCRAPRIPPAVKSGDSPDDTGDDDRRDRQPQRPFGTEQDGGNHGIFGPEGIAEIQMDSFIQIDKELFRIAFVKAVGLSYLFNLFRIVAHQVKIFVVAQDMLYRVAGHEADQEKIHCNDTEQDKDSFSEAFCQISQFFHKMLHSQKRPP